jgi:thioredoxin reductase
MPCKKSRKQDQQKGITYWNAVMASLKCQALIMASGTTGRAIALPTSTSWRAVLILEISVGFTSAEGREKSQYRAIVLGGGSEIQR